MRPIQAERVSSGAFVPPPISYAVEKKKTTPAHHLSVSIPASTNTISTIATHQTVEGRVAQLVERSLSIFQYAKGHRFDSQLVYPSLAPVVQWLGSNPSKVKRGVRSLLEQHPHVPSWERGFFAPSWAAASLPASVPNLLASSSFCCTMSKAR